MTQAVKTLTTDDAHKLLQFLRTNHNTKRQLRFAVRNYVMACVMLEAGLRVGEVVQLRVSHLFFSGNPVTNLIVTEDIAKNHKQREVPVSNYLNNAIRFLQEDFWSCSNPVNNCFAFNFPSFERSISTRQVERIIDNAGMKSLGKPVNPHLLRHTFATRLSRVANIRTVQLLLGHNNLSSTQIYTHPDAEDLRKAIDSVHSPQRPGVDQANCDQPLSDVPIEGSSSEASARARRIDGARY